MALPTKVRIREVGPREGFQTHPDVVPVEKKLELISLLNETGVRDIEVTSFVRTDKLPQMADAEEIAKRFSKKAGINYSALYLNPRGFERAEATGQFSNQGWLQIATSETFLERNSNRSIEEALRDIPAWLHAFGKYSKKLHGVMVSTAFGCNYEGEITSERLQQLIAAVNQEVARVGSTLSEVCLADTVGLGNPEKIKRGIAAVRKVVPDAEVTLHLHDTRGTAMANAYAGLLEGVSTFDASVGGMGGCPFTKGAAGNIVSEDLGYLCQSLGIETGLDLGAYARAAQFAERLLGKTLPGKYYKCTGGV